MKQSIKIFSDGSELYYDEGNFDRWCIYLSRPGMQTYAPRDTQYFQRLRELGETKHSCEKIYNDFVSIYNVTTKTFNTTICDKIATISEEYKDDQIEIEILFTIIYCGMVAEENKAFTKLGKKIKRLGMHQTLVDKLRSNEAANFSRGMGWRDILAECNKRGF